MPSARVAETDTPSLGASRTCLPLPTQPPSWPLAISEEAPQSVGIVHKTNHDNTEGRRWEEAGATSSGRASLGSVVATFDNMFCQLLFHLLGRPYRLLTLTTTLGKKC